MFHLDAIREAGGYDESIKVEDWYMLLKLSKNQKNWYIFQRYCVNTVSMMKVFLKMVLKMALEMKKVIAPYKK